VRAVTVLRSRGNPRVRRWAKLARDSGLRRKERRAIVEGPHLLAALLEQGLKPISVFATENGLARDEIKALVVEAGAAPVVLSESLFRAIADAETPPGIAAEIEIPEIKTKSVTQCVFLEGVQDPSNVGAIVRVAEAAGGSGLIAAGRSADPFGPKALRGSMGSALRLPIALTFPRRKSSDDS